MIDVCPVGALTDKTFLQIRVWFGSEPYNAHRDCKTQDVVVKPLFGCLETKFNTSWEEKISTMK
jgi:hypothetical protein